MLSCALRGLLWGHWEASSRSNGGCIDHARIVYAHGHDRGQDEAAGYGGFDSGGFAIDFPLEPWERKSRGKRLMHLGIRFELRFAVKHPLRPRVLHGWQVMALCFLQHFELLQGMIARLTGDGM